MIVVKCPTITTGNERAQSGREPAEPSYCDAAAGTALVSLETGKPRLAAAPRPNRLDAVFVVHLIATAEQVPQTRSQRRASVADATSCYETMTRIASPGRATAPARMSRMA
jgi:hypothetical protein